MDDCEFLAQFEACTFPIEDWNQRAHVKVAFLYLREHPFDVALDKLRTNIKSYNAAHGVPDSEFEGYNETTTHAFAHIILTTMMAYDEIFPTPDAETFCDTHPQLLVRQLLRFFYSPERRGHPDAKTCFVEPDLAPLPIFDSDA